MCPKRSTATPLGRLKLPGPSPALPMTRWNCPEGPKDLDAAVHGVGDEETAAGIRGEVGGEVEFARRAAAAAKFGEEFAAQVADDDLMPLRVGYEELVREDDEAGRPFELARDLEPQLALQVEGQDFAKGGVGDEDGFAVTGHGDR